MFISIFTQQSVAQCHPDDYTALRALYLATDGDNWTNNTGWDVSSATPPAGCDVCSWHGITCIGGRVTQINLLSNNLIGPLPAELGNLTNLTSLFLPVNSLTDRIPVELGNLINLRVINIGSSDLNGEIPIELSNLSNLETLDIGFCQLSGPIPSELANLMNLRILSFRGNQLSGPIPPELGNLTSLQYLWLESNQLSGPIPSELGALNDLVQLKLQQNQLEGCIPNSLNIFCGDNIDVDIRFNPNLEEQDFSAFCNTGSGACNDSNTLVCETFTASGLPLSIDAGSPNEITSVVTVPISEVVQDVKIRNLNGQHTWISDLSFSLTSPMGTTISLINRECSSEDDFSLDLEDTGLTTFNCPYNDGLSYKPADPFQSFIGEDSQGNWTLTVTDNATEDGGSLDGWTLEICFIVTDDCPSFLNITENYSNQTTVQQAENIEASNTISNNADVTYKASNCILLQPNFTVTANAEFLATIEDCPSTNIIAPPLEDLLVNTKINNSSILNIYPNPFTNETTIQYSLDVSSPVQMRVVDMLGRQVATLVENSTQPKGVYQVTFNRGKMRGGSYFIILQKGNQYESRKLILME